MMSNHKKHFLGGFVVWAWVAVWTRVAIWGSVWMCLIQPVTFPSLVAQELSGNEQQITLQWVTSQGEAKFISRAPLLEFEGVSNQLQGLIDLDGNLVDFYIDLETLDTGIELRDKHMRDSYLETAKYPFAEFTGTFLRLPDATALGSQSVTVTGTFQMHGIAQDITVDGELDFSDPDEVKLTASWIILLSDYDIEIPKAVFYELDNEQEIILSARLTPSLP